MRAQGPVDEVDPTIGNVSILLEPTRPTAYLPNSMVRMYPMRKDALDDQIQFFPAHDSVASAAGAVCGDAWRRQARGV